jgi:hypothetical protein
MNKLSLKDRIANYVKNKGVWVPGKEIEELTMKYTTYKASNASRRCREMESGKTSNGGICPILFESRKVNGAVQYRWCPKESEAEMIMSNMPSAIRIFDALPNK